jgi:hypothetical protein
MTAKLRYQHTIHLDDDDVDALEAANVLYGIPSSTYIRQALRLRCINEGLMENPLEKLKRQRAAAANAEGA